VYRAVADFPETGVATVSPYPMVEIAEEAAPDLRATIANRLDSLPIIGMHRRLTFVVAFAFFFEFADINTFSFAAPAIMNAWGRTISSMSVIVSAAFIGMFIGGTVGGVLSDRIGRKKALVLTTVLYSGASLMNASAWGPASLFTLRLLTESDFLQ
jgi:putative MFS transporter